MLLGRFPQELGSIPELTLFLRTILSSAGNDGRIRLWKATVGNVWRPAGSLGVEQAQEDDQDNREGGDVHMDN